MSNTEGRGQKAEARGQKSAEIWNWIFTVSGFTQKFFAKHGNGSINIYREMRRFANAHTECHLLQWNHHPRAYARRVARDWKPGSKIQLNAYSYGAGWWAMEFLKELEQIAPHIKVDVCVMCDPVYRAPWSKFWLKWKALGHQILEVPDNVKRVCHFYQKLTEPGGDDILVCLDTEIAYSRRLDYPHVKIDNSEEYRAACIEEAERLFGPLQIHPAPRRKRFDAVTDRTDQAPSTKNQEPGTP